MLVAPFKVRRLRVGRPFCLLGSHHCRTVHAVTIGASSRRWGSRGGSATWLQALRHNEPREKRISTEGQYVGLEIGYR